MNHSVIASDQNIGSRPLETADELADTIQRALDRSPFGKKLRYSQALDVAQLIQHYETHMGARQADPSRPPKPSPKMAMFGRDLQIAWPRAQLDLSADPILEARLANLARWGGDALLEKMGKSAIGQASSEGPRAAGTERDFRTELEFCKFAARCTMSKPEYERLETRWESAFRVAKQSAASQTRAAAEERAHAVARGLATQFDASASSLAKLRRTLIADLRHLGHDPGQARVGADAAIADALLRVLPAEIEPAVRAAMHKKS